MNFEQWRFLLFSIFGLVGIVVFALVGTGRFSEERIDRHTGQSIPVVHDQDSGKSEWDGVR